MEITFAMPDNAGQYFTWLAFFLCGYWLAYIFKNFSNILDKHGLAVFVFLMVGFGAVLITVFAYVERSENYFITIAYGVGFLLRFFTDDY